MIVVRRRVGAVSESFKLEPGGFGLEILLVGVKFIGGSFVGPGMAMPGLSHCLEDFNLVLDMVMASKVFPSLHGLFCNRVLVGGAMLFGGRENESLIFVG